MQPITARDLATLCDASLEGDASIELQGLAALDEALPNQVSFLANQRYAGMLKSTQASAVILSRDEPVEREDLVLLRCDDPNRAFTRAIEHFRPEAPRPGQGVHATAVVEAGAEIAPSAQIGPLVVIGAGAHIEPDAIIHAGCLIGADARVGQGTELFQGVVLYHGVTVGAQCIVHSGTVMGSDGFGFEPTATGWEKIPQCGTVVIEDDVEIGANCTIDRGRFGATRIGRGAKLDNAVHVAHNVQIGEAALLVAQVGIAGSSTIGKRVILAGQAGVSGHVNIVSGARIGGGSAVFKDIKEPGDYFGSPARPSKEVFQSHHRVSKLKGLMAEVRRLGERIEALEGGAGVPGEAQ